MSIALLAAALVACQKRTEPEPGPPPMTPTEMAQGTEICQKWVERVCRCADKDPSLRERCDLAKGQPEGLDLHLRLLKGERGPLNNEERRINQAAAARFIQACLIADVELDRNVCPR